MRFLDAGPFEKRDFVHPEIGIEALRIGPAADVPRLAGREDDRLTRLVAATGTFQEPRELVDAVIEQMAIVSADR